MSSSCARHRAEIPSSRASVTAAAARALLSVATVPVGALAGCAIAVASSSAARPELGVMGLAVAGLPLAVRSWRARLVAPGHGRRSAKGGAPLVPQPDSQVPAWRDTVQVTPVSTVLTAPAPAPAPQSSGQASGQAEQVGLSPELAAQVLLAPAVVSRALTGPVPVIAALVHAGERAAEVAELHRIWNSGTGPDTGPLAVVRPLPSIPGPRRPADDAPASDAAGSADSSAA